MAEHGTRTMYVHYGCRCEACCRAEHGQYLKRPEAKKRQRVFSKWGEIERRSPNKSEAKRQANIKRWSALSKRPHAHKGRIRWQEIADEFDMTCAICGTKVDPCDKWINESGRYCFGRNYPTVDHIVAIKNGGTDTYDNVQLACKRCNSKKGARLEVSA